MKPALIALFLLPTLGLAQETMLRLHYPEVPRFESLSASADEAPEKSRLPGIALESGLGLAAGAALASAVVIPLALLDLDGDHAPLRYTAAGLNVLGSTAGIWLGGKWMGRSGSPTATFALALIGQVAGVAAGAMLYDALEYHPLDEPLSFTVAFTLPTLLGVLGYNLTDR